MNFDFCAHLYIQMTEFKSTSYTKQLNVRGAVRLLGHSCHQESSSAVDIDVTLFTGPWDVTSGGIVASLWKVNRLRSEVHSVGEVMSTMIKPDQSLWLGRPWTLAWKLVLLICYLSLWAQNCADASFGERGLVLPWAAVTGQRAGWLCKADT